MLLTALSKVQLERLERVTKDMLTLIADDDDYIQWIQVMESLPDNPVTDFAWLGFMYLATERARRAVAQTN